MNDSSTVTANSSQYGLSGGLYAHSWATLVGVTCAPASGANVFGNSPGDCYLD